MPQLLCAHREEQRLHAHDLLSVQARLVLDLQRESFLQAGRLASLGQFADRLPVRSRCLRVLPRHLALLVAHPFGLSIYCVLQRDAVDNQENQAICVSATTIL